MINFIFFPFDHLLVLIIFQLCHAGGFRILLTDRNKLIMTIGGATAVAAGVYTTRSLSCSSHCILFLFKQTVNSDSSSLSTCTRLI